MSELYEAVNDLKAACPPHLVSRAMRVLKLYDDEITQLKEQVEAAERIALARELELSACITQQANELAELRAQLDDETGENKRMKKDIAELRAQVEDFRLINREKEGALIAANLDRAQLKEQVEAARAHVIVAIEACDKLRAQLAQQPASAVPDGLWEKAVSNVSTCAHLFHNGIGAILEVKAEHQRLLNALAESGVAPPTTKSLTVWFGSMPESNGKQNWTAILHKGDITEGFTIARSEHHDRVRYDADCVKYLIGELEIEPSILDYDGDMLSPTAQAEKER